MAKKKVPMEGEPVDPETGMELDAANTGDGSGEDPSAAGFEGEVTTGEHVFLENPGFAEHTQIPCPDGVPSRGSRVILFRGERYEHVSDHADGSWVYRRMA